MYKIRIEEQKVVISRLKLLTKRSVMAAQGANVFFLLSFSTKQSLSNPTPKQFLTYIEKPNH